MNKYLNCILGNLLCDSGLAIYAFFDNRIDSKDVLLSAPIAFFILTTPFSVFFTTIDSYIHPYITTDKTLQYILLVTESVCTLFLYSNEKNDDIEKYLAIHIGIKSLLTKYCLDSDAETEKLQCTEITENFSDLLEIDYTTESFLA